MPVNKQKAALIIEKALELMGKYPLCKRTLARNRKGQPVSYRSAEAAKFCAYGFIDRASFELRRSGTKITKAQEFQAGVLVETINKIRLVPFNDRPSTTKREIRTVFKKTLTELRLRASR